VGAEGMVEKRANWWGPGTKYECSNIVFAVTSIALTLAPLGTELLQLSAQSRARGKRRGFIPGAAARHRSRSRVSTRFFVYFSLFLW